MTEIFFLIVGIVGLGVGAELVTRGTLNIGEHFKISPIFLGLTVLAFGSDLPELMINISGAIKKLQGTDTSGLIVGDAIGSSFGQIGLILGIVGIVGVLKMTKKQRMRDGLTMIGSVLILFLVASNGHISRIEGIILILIYVFYILALYREEKVKKRVILPPKLHILWSGLSLIGGFVLLLTAAHLTLENALTLSDAWGVSQSLIGILLVGVGTSLPELAISISAIRKHSAEIAVGNLIGSNIFDVLVPIGAAAVIAELNIEQNMIFFDIPSLFILSILVIVLFKYKDRLRKREAMLLIIVFCAYTALRITIFS